MRAWHKGCWGSKVKAERLSRWRTIAADYMHARQTMGPLEAQAQFRERGRIP